MSKPQLQRSETADSKRPIVEGIAKLFNNPDHADIKIYIGKYELPAHSVVLAIQSKFFQKALSENFKEGKDKEFHFNEGSMHAYWRVFQYMYTGDYSAEPAEVLDAQDDDELVKDVRVYTTADFFMLNGLKQLALPRFRSKLDRLWVSELLVDCIREIYESTTESDHGLRNAVIEVVHTYRDDLWKRKAFRDLISDGGGFAVDLMSEFITE